MKTQGFIVIDCEEKSVGRGARVESVGANAAVCDDLPYPCL